MDNTLDIVDIGVNLAHRSFQNDRKEVIERAFGAGVRRMIITGTNLAASEAAVRMARESPNHLFATAGVHPHDSRNCTDQTIAELCRLAASDEVVAIGECGLDFNRDFSPRPLQEKWFEAQVALAEELEMPSSCTNAMLTSDSAISSSACGRVSRPSSIVSPEGAMN